MILEDLRKISLLNWLENDLGLTINACEPASSDASFRRYFRISLPEQQLIVMDAPPDKENIPQFIKVADLLRQSSIKVPHIYHQNLEDGFLVLEDFGSRSFLDHLTPENAPILYGNALYSLFQLQTKTNPDGLLPRYDEALLRRELGIFDDWFLHQYLGMEMPEPLWDAVKDSLVNSALEQPLTCVHRDYHSRNLMLLEDNSPGIIDFQDAVIGPITYDIVSLLRDCYIAWPEADIKQWLGNYYQKLSQAGLTSADLPLFTRWFDFMGIQRHLKAIGIFSRLHLRDGKSSYLNDIPRTLNYVVTQTGNYPELAEFNKLLALHIVPKYKGLQ